MEETWLERLLGMPSVVRQMIELDEGAKARQAVGLKAAPPPPVGSANFDKKLNIAGNFDMTSPIGLGMAGMIRAYHASPHDFEKFSLEHLGKGEGVQAYSPGLYFAGNERVADHYFHKFNKPEIRFGGENLKNILAELRTPLTDILESQDNMGPRWAGQLRDHAADLITRGKGDLGSALRYLELDNSFDMNPYSKADVIHLFKKLRDKVGDTEPEVRDTAKRYVVDLDVEPHQLLDWDNELANQPLSFGSFRSPTGRYSYAGRLLEPGTMEGVARGDATIQAYAQANPELRAKFLELANKIADSDLEPAWKFIRENPDGEFSPLYFNPVQSGWTGERLVRHLDKKDPKAFRQQFLDSGIPGLKYWDGFSRGGGSGSKNYVIYDDDLIKIVDKK